MQPLGWNEARLEKAAHIRALPDIDDAVGNRNVGQGGSGEGVAVYVCHAVRYHDTGQGAVSKRNGVSSIADYAFDSTGLVGLVIPGSVTNIGDYAFYDCSDLTGVMIGNGVGGIGINAFADCASLKSATIPGSVTNIADFAFYDCSGLADVTIGSGVRSIGPYAFEYTALVSITIPASVTNIGEGAFVGCYATLASVYFQGNAPGGDSTVFGGDSATTAYYLPGTTGWGATYGGIPAIELAALTFTATPTKGTAPLTVSFTAQGIDSADKSITHWNWIFGDGSTSADQNPSHTYATAGTFYPALFATNSAGATVFGSGPASITVLAAGPVRPNIGGLSLSGTNLVLQGLNGVSGATYYVLMTTNLDQPLSQWAPVATNVLNAGGNFTITVNNTTSPAAPQRFYILQTPWPL